MPKYRCSLCGWSGDNPTILNREEVFAGPEAEAFDDVQFICPNGCENENGEPRMVSSWGGRRPGAGRPATGAMPNRTIRMTDDEYQKVKEFLKELRASQK